MGELLKVYLYTWAVWMRPLNYYHVQLFQSFSEVLRRGGQMGQEFIVEEYEDIGILSGLGTKCLSKYMKATLLHEIVWWRHGLIALCGLTDLLEFSSSKDIAA